VSGAKVTVAVASSSQLRPHSEPSAHRVVGRGRRENGSCWGRSAWNNREMPLVEIRFMGSAWHTRLFLHPPSLPPAHTPHTLAQTTDHDLRCCGLWNGGRLESASTETESACLTPTRGQRTCFSLREGIGPSACHAMSALPHPTQPPSKWVRERSTVVALLPLLLLSGDTTTSCCRKRRCGWHINRGALTHNTERGSEHVWGARLRALYAHAHAHYERSGCLLRSCARPRKERDSGECQRNQEATRHGH
jgi:hypothetical protein